MQMTCLWYISQKIVNIYSFWVIGVISGLLVSLGYHIKISYNVSLYIKYSTLSICTLLLDSQWAKKYIRTFFRDPNVFYFGKEYQSRFLTYLTHLSSPISHVGESSRLPILLAK